jgi:hypothetical protein
MCYYYQARPTTTLQQHSQTPRRGTGGTGGRKEGQRIDTSEQSQKEEDEDHDKTFWERVHNTKKAGVPNCIIKEVYSYYKEHKKEKAEEEKAEEECICICTCWTSLEESEEEDGDLEDTQRG